MVNLMYLSVVLDDIFYELSHIIFVMKDIIRNLILFNQALSRKLLWRYALERGFMERGGG